MELLQYDNFENTSFGKFHIQLRYDSKGINLSVRCKNLIGKFGLWHIYFKIYYRQKRLLWYITEKKLREQRFKRVPAFLCAKLNISLDNAARGNIYIAQFKFRNFDFPDRLIKRSGVSGERKKLFEITKGEAQKYSSRTSRSPYPT